MSETSIQNMAAPIVMSSHIANDQAHVNRVKIIPFPESKSRTSPNDSVGRFFLDQPPTPNMIPITQMRSRIERPPMQSGIVRIVGPRVSIIPETDDPSVVESASGDSSIVSENSRSADPGRLVGHGHTYLTSDFVRIPQMVGRTARQRRLATDPAELAKHLLLGYQQEHRRQQPR